MGTTQSLQWKEINLTEMWHEKSKENRLKKIRDGDTSSVYKVGSEKAIRKVLENWKNRF